MASQNSLYPTTARRVPSLLNNWGRLTALSKLPSPSLPSPSSTLAATNTAGGAGAGGARGRRTPTSPAPLNTSFSTPLPASTSHSHSSLPSSSSSPPPHHRNITPALPPPPRPPRTLRHSTLPLPSPAASPVSLTSPISPAISPASVEPPSLPPPPPIPHRARPRPRPPIQTVPRTATTCSAPPSTCSTPLHSPPHSSPSSPTSPISAVDTQSPSARFLTFQGVQGPRKTSRPHNHVLVIPDTRAHLPPVPPLRPPTTSRPLNSSHSHPVSPSHHPHSPRHPDSKPVAQTICTSALSNASSGSFRSALNGSLKAANIFNVKRHRHQRLPLPFSAAPSASSNVESERHLRARQKKRTSNDFSTQHTLRMHQVERMTDSHSQQGFPRQLHESTIHTASDAPVAVPPVQKQTLSSKRMRPPLAEISVSNIPSPFSTTATLSSSAQHSPHSHANITPHTKSTSPHSKSNMYTNTIDSSSSSIHSQIMEAREPLQMHDHSNFISTGPLALSLSAAQPTISSEERQRLPHFHSAPILVPSSASAEALSRPAMHHPQNSISTTATIVSSETRKPSSTRTVSRGHLTRDAKALRNRIRKLWQDPRQPEPTRTRRDPKNQYMLLEEALIGILQIVPPIIQNAGESSAALGLIYPSKPPAAEPSIHRPAASYPISINTAELSTGPTTALPSSPSQWNTSALALAPPSTPGIPTSKSSGSTPTSSGDSRARTTSSNSVSTASATRYQIATSILQPTEPCLTDVAQPTVRSPTNISLLGEPALSTIASAAHASGANKSSPEPRLQESNEILVSKLLSLSNIFTAAIRSLCEQQNEKVLRFDDDMILELLTRWEQEAGKEVQDQEPENNSTTSLVTLGATNALERYQHTVGRVWEETETILSSVRKIREIVEYGRVQHFSDFDGDDSEEDAVEKDQETKRNLYSTLLFHANGLITVLGEFLECVSGILRLVGTIKTQRKSTEEQREDDQLPIARAPEVRNIQPPAGLVANEPRPIKHLDPALMRKLKRKTPFKSIADKVRRSLSDFAKRSTTSLLTIFPPLGDGTNDGFSWDSYSDGEYDSEEWAPTDMGSSIFGDEDVNVRTLSPPDSPEFNPIIYQQRHRRLSSGNSSGFADQYWPGSIRLGFSDDNQSPPNPASPSSVVATPLVPTFGTQITALSPIMSPERIPDVINARFQVAEPPRGTVEPISITPTEAQPYYSLISRAKSDGRSKRASSLFRKNSQNSTFSGVNISAPIPTTVPRPFSVYSSASECPTPTRNNYKARPPKPPTDQLPETPSPVQSYFKADEIMQETGSNKRSSLYLATRSISPQQVAPLTLDSPFTRQTSIRMGHDRNRYSVKMPADDIGSSIQPVPSNISPMAFWRRRSYNDVLEKNWQALQRESFQSGVSDVSMQSTSATSEFPQHSSRSSIRMTTFDFMVPSFSSKANSRSGSRPISGTSFSRPFSERFASRRHSSPLALSTQKALADMLSRRSSIASHKSQRSGSQTATAINSNRTSVYTMPTVDENVSQNQPQQHQHQQHQQQHQHQYQHQQQRQQQMHSSPIPVYNFSSEQQFPFLDTDPSTSLPHLRMYPKPTIPSHEGTWRSENPDEGLVTMEPTGLESSDGRITTELTPRPISAARLSEMKRAWEILNMDVKRLNQYSHLRAYAKTVTPQSNNNWALSHPHALQSTTSPRVLHICENGVDVLVLEMVGGHLHVVAGLLEKLIERLADQNTQDSEYLSCFLLSHSFFVDSEDLLDKLIARFHIQPRQGETMYYQKWRRVIQCKVLCAMERWIKIQFEDFDLNPNLLKTLKRFLEADAHQGGFAFEAGCILEAVNIRCLSRKKNCSVIMEQNRFCLQRSRTRKISLSKSQNRPTLGRSPGSPGASLSSTTETIPAPPGNVSSSIEYGPAPELSTGSPILHLSALELARYLTLVDMKAFRSITVFELMSGWWKRRQAQENKSQDTTADDETTRSVSGASVETDNPEDGAIEAFTRRANMLSYWVAHEIVSIAGTKPRKQLIKKFIEVARTCRELNNLHTCMFIVSALTSTPVRRLSSTWKMVSSKDMETLRQLEKLLDISGNMRCYRQAFEEAEAPAIPFLPILLKDITFILDGNPTMIASRINASSQQQSPPVSSDGRSSSNGGDTNSVEAAGAPESGEGFDVNQPQQQQPQEQRQQAPTGDNGGGGASGHQLINFDKFRRLTQYVEHVVDMAKSADYWFEPQLLRQARVFRPSSPTPAATNGPSQSSTSSRGGSHSVNNSSSTTLPYDGPRAPLDDISEVVERRLVKASGLYGVHQRVVEVEFTTTTKPKSTSLWKGGVVSSVASGVGSSLVGGGGHSGAGGSGSGSGIGSGSGSLQGSTVGEAVIRAVQGEEEYLMGLSLMCEPGR